MASERDQENRSDNQFVIVVAEGRCVAAVRNVFIAVGQPDFRTSAMAAIAVHACLVSTDQASLYFFDYVTIKVT